jgi:Flp pilus assembly protein TadG
MRDASRSGAMKRARRRGIASAEFALVLPLLILLVLICIDFGRFAYTYIALKNAAQAGASYAMMNSYVSSTQTAWTNSIQTTARNEMTGQIGYDSTKLTTTADVTIETTGLRRVRVTATYNSFSPMISWPGIPSSVTLKCASEVRAIR